MQGVYLEREAFHPFLHIEAGRVQQGLLHRGSSLPLAGLQLCLELQLRVRTMQLPVLRGNGLGSLPRQQLHGGLVPNPVIGNIAPLRGCRSKRGLPSHGALPESAFHAATAGPAAARYTDMLVAQPAIQLILQSVGHLDASAILQPLYTALVHNHGVDGQSIADGVQSAAAALPHVVAPDDAVAAAAHLTTSHVLSDASLPALTPQLHTLASWAMDKLATVQSIDPASYDSMRSSLSGVLEALQAAFPHPTTADLEAASVPWTNALVLGVQQLVTTMRAPGTGGVGLPTIVAAQEAMQAAVASGSMEATSLARAASSLAGSAAAGGEIPAGLSGLIQFCLAMIAMIVASVPRQGWKQQLQQQYASDEVPLRYDVPALDAYFSKRPLQVMQRNADVVGRFATFLMALVMDWQLGKWEANMPARAVAIRQVVEDLGPAYIKIAQALSTRVDIIPEVYANAFCALQDNVRTFSTVEARKVLEDGLQQPVESVFEWLSEEPVAAASLGQVYRGKLLPQYGGGEVAVKVQRPGALESVAQDIFIMRRSAVMFSQIPGMSDKWASALDDWASRFFQEMDYELEAHNTITFKQHMTGLQGITVATVYPELTSRRIIVTGWIEGERLSDSKADDVRVLCSTLLNCYLIQLLETGLLHADPHPGNLMRTPDGKIVVLDFGLMTEVTEDQRIALVEFIAHLSAEDWNGVAHDLVNLGFMPEGLPPDAAAHIAPVMQKVMGQLIKGGGLKDSFNITAVASELSGAAMNYKLCVPPYFALVLRAFSVIEGIALRVDPNYAIVPQCMPYMSRRLLSDNNPRMRAALRQLLYGNSTRLNIERLQKMISQFGAFTTAAATSETAGQARLTSGPTFSAAYSNGSELAATSLFPDDSPVLTEPVKDVLKVVFSKDGSYAQEILVDEAVAAIDAMSREGLRQAMRLVTTSVATVAALRGMESLGPLRSMLLPLPLPLDLLHSMQPAVALTAEDKQALNTIRAVLDLMVPAPGAPPGPNVAQLGFKAVRAVGEVAPLLPELLPGMQATLELFIRQLVRRMALRLADDLDSSMRPAYQPQQQQQQYYRGMQQATPPPPQSSSKQYTGYNRYPPSY